jgi:ubiquinone/menaquinone biosynthesis C-methylase UbiE
MAQYDLIAKDYLKAQQTFFEGRDDPARTFIRRSLPSDLEGRKLLDLGCGGGFDLQYFEERGATVYGIDESEEMIKHAQQLVKTPQLLTVHDMAQPLPIGNDQLDIVIARFSLHYLSNLHSLYTEVYRVLREEGQFIFVVEHPLVDLFRSKSKEYGKQEMITIKLYNGAVPLTFPTHTLTDYISPAFCLRFRIKELFEYTGTDAEPTGEVIPNALCINAQALF